LTRSHEIRGTTRRSRIPLRSPTYESGPDLDADGDVDGGLFDNIQNVFG
jgi:hypothetical protein